MAMDRQTILNRLAVFGEQDPRQPWSDYSGCGFTVADAPALAELVGDVSLLNPEGDDVWIPLHAWRALQPLMPAGLHELLLTLNPLAEDDWASVELPKVIAAAGGVAIEPLQAFIRDTANAEYARSIAVDALIELVRYDVGWREQVMAVFASSLQVGTDDDEWVNSSLVSGLVEMKAVEAVEVIREAYARNKVDISFHGDLEGVEMDLGIREKRDTPRSDYGWVKDEPFPPPSLEPVAQDMSLEEWDERIGQFLNFYSTEASLESFIELHGFFTAIGCAPEPVQPSEWLPKIWGGAEFEPEWSDTQTLQVFFELMMPLHNWVMQELQDVDNFTATFARGELEGQKFIEFGSWCAGFLQGADVGGVPVVGIPGVMPLLIVLEDVADNELYSFSMSAAEAKAQERHLNETVRKICRLGRGGKVATPPMVHTAPKAGRNDPCPCGSGKKYKKCCLH